MARTPAPVSPPVVLTIAGSDSGGGAGIQADLKTIEAGGGFGTSAVTSVTAQNTTGVQGSHLLPVEEIEAQIDAVLDDFDVAAVKTGMLATTPVIETVRLYADRLPNLVVDPVMMAASGDRLLDPKSEDAYQGLITKAALVTPNADEAEVLTGVDVSDRRAAREAGQRLVEMGANAALVKGGHIPGETVVDTLVTPERVQVISHPRVDTDATHGSGCALSSAIATRLAHGDDLQEAVAAGVDLLSSAVRYNLDVGSGPGAVHHLVDVRDRAAGRATADAVESLVATLAERDIEPLVPADGMAVAGATPYATDATDVAAGHLYQAADAGDRCVRFESGGHLPELLLAARETRPDLSAACSYRLAEDLRAAIDTLDWSHGSIEASGEPAHVWETIEGSEGPVALFDHRQDATVLLAVGAERLLDCVDAVLDVVASG